MWIGLTPRAQARPRIISDNGPQFNAKDFKEFIRVSGMTHVRTSPYYPQSNGKIERWHKSLKGECIRPGTPLSLEDARRLVEGYVEHYNNVRLNTAIGYITPKGVLAGRQQGDPCQYWEPAGSTTSGDFQIQVKPPSPFRSAASQSSNHYTQREKRAARERVTPCPLPRGRAFARVVVLGPGAANALTRLLGTPSRSTWMVTSPLIPSGARKLTCAGLIDVMPVARPFTLISTPLSLTGSSSP